MRPFPIYAVAVLAACGGGKVELRQDTAKINALLPDTTSAVVGRPVDTSRRIMDRPAAVDYRTDAQKALRNKKLVRAPTRVIRKSP